MIRSRHGLALALLLLGACGQDESPITQLVLVADTNIAALDDVQFVISSDTQGSRSADASRVGQNSPSYLSVVHEQGPLGPITVSARGLRAGTLVVERTQRVFFVQDQTRVVTLHLVNSCVGASCTADQTCSEHGCVSQTLSEGELPVWSGAPPRVAVVNGPDAGVAADAGVDAGVDAGTQSLDAGDGGSVHGQDGALDASHGDDAQVPTDAGVDAGDAAARDASIRDAATYAGDAGPKLTQCADAGLVDLQSDMNHCGKCTKICKVDVEQCSAGACVKK